MCVSPTGAMVRGRGAVCAGLGLIHVPLTWETGELQKRISVIARGRKIFLDDRKKYMFIELCSLPRAIKTPVLSVTPHHIPLLLFSLLTVLDYSMAILAPYSFTWTIKLSCGSSPSYISLVLQVFLSVINIRNATWILPVLPPSNTFKD